MSDATPQQPAPQQPGAAQPAAVPPGVVPPYTMQYAAVPGASPDPLATAVQSPWGHLVVLVLAVVGIVVNVIGGAGFPANAPVEWIMNAGLTIDLVAVALACGIGLLVTKRRRLTRPSHVFPWVGLGLSAVALGAWAVVSQGLWATLFFEGRGHYGTDTMGAFLFGIPWALGAIFSAYGVRANTKPYLNAAAIVGIVLWAVVLLGVLTSALLYAADLTD